MAVTITEVDFDTLVSESGVRYGWGLFDIDFDNSYPTGGETVDLSRWFRSILDVSYPVKTSAEADGYVFGRDPTNFPTGSFTIEVFFGDYSEIVNDGPYVEMNNGNATIDDLVVRVRVWGYAQ